MFLKKVCFMVVSILVCSVMVGAMYSSTASAGSMKKIAVFQIKNASQVNNDELNGEAVADMLTDGLVNCGKFSVLEREELKTVLGEQALQNNFGDQNAGNIAEMGRLANVDYVVTGKIVKAGIERTNFFGIATQNQIKIKIAIRLIDVTTATIVYSGQAEGIKTTGSISDGNGRKLFSTKADAGIYSDAAQDAVMHLVNNLASRNL